MKTTESTICSLTINQLELSVFLGWPQDERLQTQIVSVDIHLNLSEPPTACITDNLSDTFCYSWLTDQIKEAVSHKPFRLIEHLAHYIHQIASQRLQTASMISVVITKKPQIDGLQGGVSFSCTSFLERKPT
jgi:FolB domain-containing protein